MGEVINLAAERFARGPMTEEKARVIVEHIRNPDKGFALTLDGHGVPRRVSRKLYLREWRELRGMTVTRMSLYLGWGRDVVREYEVGRKQPSLSRIEAMCRVLHVSVEDIYRDPSEAA
jgi:DNA-binding XRE family transcriptional regulator